LERGNEEQYSVDVIGYGAFLAISASYAADDLSAAGVQLIDKRPVERKSNSRDSVFAATMVLGDKTLKPSTLARFQEALKKHQTTQGQAIELVVDDFAVIDYFPKRLAGMSNIGGLTGGIVQQMLDSEMDWSLVDMLGLPPKGEAIICVFSGTINGKAATVVAHSEYKTSIATLSIRSSKPFKEAVDLAIDKAAADALN
jgi:hypothetical protein